MLVRKYCLFLSATISILYWSSIVCVVSGMVDDKGGQDENVFVIIPNPLIMIFRSNVRAILDAPFKKERQKETAHSKNDSKRSFVESFLRVCCLSCCLYVYFLVCLDVTAFAFVHHFWQSLN